MPTYKLFDVKPTDIKPKTFDVKAYLSSQKVVRKNQGKVLMNTQPPNPVRPYFGNGFVGACYEAYSHHHHLTLRPDDVWLAIVLTFANYVDKHAEEMRKCFVDHDGKKSLNITGGGTIMTANWDGMIDQMCDQVEKNTKQEVRKWLVPDFSTTTKKDRVIGGVVLMGAMKHYFEYGFSLTCGLPSITLEGKLEDWQAVRKRADKLVEFAKGGAWKAQPDLEKWHKILCPVLDKFIETYQGSVDLKFWSAICDYQGGSGISRLSGWLLAFVPFYEGKYRLNHPLEIAKSGKYGQVDTDCLESALVVEVPVKINDNGREYETIFYAGALVSQYDVKEDRMMPSFDWAMIDVTASKSATSKVVPKEDVYDEEPSFEPQPEPTWEGPSEVSLPVVHKHMLYYVDTLQGHRCDMCKTLYLTKSYRCFDCDYDYCLSCYGKKNVTQTA